MTTTTRHLSTPQIPLKGLKAGRQHAGWTPRAVAVDGLGNRALTSQGIPVAEGVTLNADVYTPKVPGRYPAVVSFAAYTSEGHTAGLPTGSNEAGSPPVFTDRGYCPVIVERRGMGRSTGDQTMIFSDQDVDDHEKVIAWAAEQPWCNGEVVLFGSSYYGITQLQVAARKPPALKAFFANEICTDFYRHLIQFGGVPGSFFFALWMGAALTDKDVARRISPNTRALISHLTNGPLHPLMEKVLHRKVDRMFEKFMAATPTGFFKEIYARWMFDEKTRVESTMPEGPAPVLDEIDVPFTVVQNLGYFNLHNFGAYDLFDHASTPAEDKYLIMGPPMFELPVLAWQGEALAFFDHVLRGVDNGYAEQPHVRYWVDGGGQDRTGEFAGAAAFPPAGGEVLRLDLASDGPDHLIHRMTTDTPADGHNSWAAVPRGVPVVGGMEEVANQLLTFELPITEATRLAGPVTADLIFSCTEIDSYVMARLSRVDADGTRHLLSLGGIRPAARHQDTARSTGVEIAIDSGRREQLTPGEPVQLRFSLTPGPVQLRAGEKLRLDLGSRTDLLISSPAENHVQLDLPVPPYLSRNTVHFGGRSWIEVTSVPAGA